MPFNLRGGRPKNRGQGIYWVQRHLADQRAASATAVRRAKEDALIRRRERIAQGVVWFFRHHDSVNVNAAGKARIEAAIAGWSAALELANREPRAGNISKLCTAGKNVIVAFAKAAGIATTWNPDSKLLTVADHPLDFG